ncbi:TRAP transporter small permease [Succinatimonas hippei]|uniref:TRAP transporter small permease n=1 Tax=Succinatimonas hippei TaxID=626938 RepID=UPI002492FECC|nr:TRAP transporter small permease [Succinatimonas hippei]
MSFLLSLDKKFAAGEAVVIGVLLLIMSAFAFLQVLARYCFSISIVWCEEVTRYCMIWMTFIGTAYAVSKQEHINIDMMTEWVKHKTGFDLRHILNILILGFSLFCVFYGWHLVVSTQASGQMTPALRIPMYWVYLIMEFSLVLTAFHSLVRVIDFKINKEK